MAHADRIEYGDGLRPTTPEVVATIRALRHRVERGDIGCAICGKPASRIGGSSVSLAVFCDFHFINASLDRIAVRQQKQMAAWRARAGRT